MKNRIWKTVIVAALTGPALMFAGCKSGNGGSTDSGAAGVALAQPVAIVQAATGSSSALKSTGAMLIRTQAEYDQIGDANLFPGKVDFDQHDIVIVALGEQPTGGYSVEITSIQQVGDELAVVGKASKPGPDAVTTQALTYPYEAVLIANTTASTIVPYID